MRALTINEITGVSGGEAPCITLRTQCVGPPPTAAEMRNELAGLAAAAGLFSLVPGPTSAPSNVLSKVAAALAWVAHQFTDDGEGEGDDGKPR